MKKGVEKRVWFTVSPPGPRINTVVVSPVPRLIIASDTLGSWSNEPHGVFGLRGKSCHSGEGQVNPLILAPPQAKIVGQNQYRDPGEHKAGGKGLAEISDTIEDLCNVGKEETVEPQG